MEKHGYRQLVCQPTTDSGSLLDHIYFNKDDINNDEVIVDIHDVYYSDHDSVFVSTNCL